MPYVSVQGVCMSTYIVGKADEDDLDIVQQLEDMYQVCLHDIWTCFCYMDFT